MLDFYSLARPIAYYEAEASEEWGPVVVNLSSHENLV